MTFDERVVLHRVDPNPFPKMLHPNPVNRAPRTLHPPPAERQRDSEGGREKARERKPDRASVMKQYIFSLACALVSTLPFTTFNHKPQPANRKRRIH